MARTIDLSRTVHDLVADNPEVATIMRDLGFADIAKPMALETVGRVMTIPRGAQIKGIDLNASGLSKLEGQLRYVTDFELKAISEVLGMSYEELLG